MRNFKKLLTLGIVSLAVGVTSITAFAATSNKTTIETVNLEEYKTSVLQAKKDILAQQVAQGIITQERADEIIKAIEENQKLCDGTGTAQIGKNFGARFGMGKGNGVGQGKGLCNRKCGN